MDFSKIGKFISFCRKEKGLTQEKLGDFLNVDRRTISKWENGVYAPDITLLEPLSSVLGVSVSELLNGKKDKSKKNNYEILEAVKYYNNSYKKRIKKFILIFIIFIILFFGLYVIINNFFSYKIIKLYSTSDDYVADSMIVHNNFEEYIFIGNITHNDINIGTDLEKKVTNLRVALYSDSNLIVSQEHHYDDVIYFSDALNNIQLNYTKVDTSKKNDYYMLIEYMLENGETTIDKIILSKNYSFK